MTIYSPLSKIRVIDFGHHLAGPLAGMILADQGAEVIRVERPGDSGSESPLNAVLGRGKKRVSLDLKTDSDREYAQRLVSSADVLIENFRPGVMGRLGLGPGDVCRQNPGLIYLSLPGFASTDEERRSLPAWEGVIAAACGAFTDLNVLRSLLGMRPVYTPLPYGSVYGAVHGAIAVMMALFAREASGRGDVIEVPLASAAFSAMGMSILKIPDQPRRYDMPPLHPLVRHGLMPIVRRLLSCTGPKTQDRAYRIAQRLTPALMTNYRCADGRQLFVLAMDHRRHATDLLNALGLSEQLQREGVRVCNPYVADGWRKNLAEGAGLSLRTQRQLAKRLAGAFKTKPADVWEQQLGQAGVPCAVQRTTAEWLNIEPLHSSGIVVDMRHPQHGQIRQPGMACWVHDGAAETASVPRTLPVEDGDRDKLVAWEGRGVASDGKDLASGSDRCPALQGIRVLDLSTMIAAPVCARTLAEYGADVIKVGSPDPYHGPRMLCWFGVDVDQGKRSILVDLKTDEGRAILHKLVADADILVHNMSEPAAKKLGLQKAALENLNPHLIVTRLGSYEGPLESALARRKAYDPVLQAATGIMVRYGGSGEPEYHGIASCVDYITGHLGALAAALALFHRTRIPNGHGAEAVTSLAQGAQLAQSNLAYNFAGRVWDEATGQKSLGEGPFQRLYLARDGWFFLGAAKRRRNEILAEPALKCPAGMADADDEEIVSFLEERLRQETIAFWDQSLRPLDIAVYPVEPLERFQPGLVANRPDERFMCGGPSLQVIRQKHPIGREVETVAPAHARLKLHPLRYVDPAPKLGQHTMEILNELGVSPTEQRRLSEAGIVSQGVSEEYLPS